MNKEIFKSIKEPIIRKMQGNPTLKKLADHLGLKPNRKIIWGHMEPMNMPMDTAPSKVVRLIKVEVLQEIQSPVDRTVNIGFAILKGQGVKFSSRSDLNLEQKIWLAAEDPANQKNMKFIDFVRARINQEKALSSEPILTSKR